LALFFQPNGKPNNIARAIRSYGSIYRFKGQRWYARFPGLKLCAAHGGGYLPSYAARSDAIGVTFPNRVTPLKKRPTEYLKQLYFDSIVFTPEALRHLAAETAPSQIVMGTDYPYPWTSTSVDHILPAPGFTDEERAAMLGGTAAKLLGIGD
jgi:aminocarboxymuconate-semialdehyde decarboxylase